MNKNKFTPGPWTAIHLKSNSHCPQVVLSGSTSEKGVFPSESNRVSLNNSGDSEENDANAKLIACAPEMLVLLKQIAEKIKNSDEWWIDVPDRGGFDLEKINSLIQKATK